MAVGLHTIVEFFELIINFLQKFVMMIDTPDVDFPEEFKLPGKYLKFFTLDSEFFDEQIPALPADLRTQFVVVSVVVPMVCVFLALLGLQTALFIACFFFTLVGVLGLLVFTFAQQLKILANFEIDPTVHVVMLYGGGACLAIAIVLIIIDYNQRNKKKAGVAKTAAELQAGGKSALEFEEEEARENFPKVSMALHALLFIVLLGSGLVMVQAVPAPIDPTEQAGELSLGVGITILVLTFFQFIWFLMGFFPDSRVRRVRLGRWGAKNFMKAILIVFSLAYIPIAMHTALIFNCNTFSCGPGFRLPDEGSLLPFDTRINGGCHVCDPAPNQRCSAAHIAEVCGGAAQDRVEIDRSIVCDGTFTLLMWPGAFIVMISLVFGIPVLYRFMVQSAATLLVTKFEMLPSTEDEEREEAMDDGEIFHRKVLQSRNVVKYLYAPFEYKWRYWRLFSIVQRLLLVAFTVYRIRLPVAEPQAIASIAALFIHVVFTVLVIAYRPYQNVAQDRVAGLMQVCLVITSIVGVLVYYKVDLPNWLSIVLVIVAVIFPLFVAIAAIYLDLYGSRSAQSQTEKDKEEEKTLMQRLQQVKQEEKMHRRKSMGRVGSASFMPSSGEDHRLQRGATTRRLSHLVGLDDDDDDDRMDDAAAAEEESPTNAAKEEKSSTPIGKKKGTSPNNLGSFVAFQDDGSSNGGGGGDGSKAAAWGDEGVFSVPVALPPPPPSVVKSAVKYKKKRRKSSQTSDDAGDAAFALSGIQAATTVVFTKPKKKGKKGGKRKVGFNDEEDVRLIEPEPEPEPAEENRKSSGGGVLAPVRAKKVARTLKQQLQSRIQERSDIEEADRRRAAEGENGSTDGTVRIHIGDADEDEDKEEPTGTTLQNVVDASEIFGTSGPNLLGVGFGGSTSFEQEKEEKEGAGGDDLDETDEYEVYEEDEEDVEVMDVEDDAPTLSQEERNVANAFQSVAAQALGGAGGGPRRPDSKEAFVETEKEKRLREKKEHEVAIHKSQRVVEKVKKVVKKMKKATKDDPSETTTATTASAGDGDAPPAKKKKKVVKKKKKNNNNAGDSVGESSQNITVTTTPASPPREQSGVVSNNTASPPQSLKKRPQKKGEPSAPAPTPMDDDLSHLSESERRQQVLVKLQQEVLMQILEEAEVEEGNMEFDMDDADDADFGGTDFGAMPDDADASTAVVVNNESCVIREHETVLDELADLYKKIAMRKAIATMQQVVDEEINTAARRIFLRFLMITGVMLTISLGLCFVAIVAGRRNSVYPPTYTQTGPMNILSEYVGYPTWGNFTASCACLNYTLPPPRKDLFKEHIYQVEKWVCENKLVKERIRGIYAFGRHLHGFAIRPMCGMNFQQRCRPSYNVTSNTLSFDCPSTFVGEYHNSPEGWMREYEKHLW